MSEIRPGYKQTEVGVIPEEWDTVNVAQIGETLIGLTYAPSQVADSGTLVLRSSNVQSGKLAFADNVYVQMEVPDRAIVRQDDILLCVRNGSRDLIGKSALISKAAAGSAFGAFMGVVRVPSPIFVNALFSSSIVGKQISSTLGATINQITNGDLRKFVLPWPPRCSERVAIADALGDADALIEALEALIAKERALKQGAMQDLLTGHRRLPGFQGEWIERQLGSLGSFAKGSGVRKDEANSGPLPCVRYGELYTHHTDIIRRFNSHISPEVAKDALRLRAGDVLFAGSGETKEEIGKCAALVEDVEAYAGGDIIVLRPSGSSAEFLGYYLNMPDVQRQKASKGQGDAVVHISSRALASIDLKLPPTLDEQRAIAAVLSDMDAEIAALEDKLAKAQAVKQGMMQVLLTGEIRLV